VKMFWMMLAGVCGALAVFFVFQDDFDKAFVAAAGGAVCWFLSYRQQLKESLPDEEDDQSEEDEESDEEVRS
jgi:hypothetical protein